MRCDAMAGNATVFAMVVVVFWSWRVFATRSFVVARGGLGRWKREKWAFWRRTRPRAFFALGTDGAFHFVHPRGRSNGQGVLFDFIGLSL